MKTKQNRRGLMTADEFLVYPVEGKRDELVRGKVEVNPLPGGRHGLVAGNVFRLLSTFVERHDLGRCFDAIGYELPNLENTVRGPDVSFVRAGRLPAAGVGPGFLQLAPDLAVEVLSPTNRAGKIKQKVADYLTAGTRLIWIIDPAKRRVSVVSPTATRLELSEGESLDGAEVVPGFRCSVDALFEGAAR